jgi:signal peptidase I
MPVNLKIAATVLIVLLAFLPVPERFLQYFTYFRAYSVTSDSMCPTLCPDDNFVADASFFKEHAPSRGDIVVLLRSGSDMVSIKRIVGLPGEVVSGSETGEIVVNEQPLHLPLLPESCGKPSPTLDFSSARPFDHIEVPKDAFFVVGDFRTHSYDSRESSFGFVRRSELLAKPRYIYWSAAAYPTYRGVGIPFPLDNQLLLAYSGLWVKARPIPITLASCWRFLFFVPRNAHSPQWRLQHRIYTNLAQCKPL